MTIQERLVRQTYEMDDNRVLIINGIVFRSMCVQPSHRGAEENHTRHNQSHLGALPLMMPV